MTSQSTKQAVVLSQRAPALAAYPHARVAGNLLFVSGVSSRRFDNTHDGVVIHTDGRVSKDIRAQTKAVLGNIASIVRAAGADLADIVDISVFLVDMTDYDGMNEAYNEVFRPILERGAAPARTTVAVHQLPHPHLLVEMKAVALLPAVAEGNLAGLLETNAKEST